MRVLRAAFSANGMRLHLQKLLAWNYGARLGRATAEGDWTDEFVVHWASVLRVPPYERALKVRGFAQACERCGDAPPTHVVQTFPGGYVVSCSGCSVEWLVLDGIA